MIASQYRDHVFALQTLSHLARQSLARVVVHHGERPQPASIKQRIRHKSHATNLVNCAHQLLGLT